MKALKFLIPILLFYSCSTVKKSQHAVTEKQVIAEVKTKDSSQAITDEKKKAVSEAKTFTKEIEIFFPDPPNTVTEAKEYFGSDTATTLRTSTATRIKTNKPSAVTLKANGDVVLSEAPKSINIKEKQAIQKIDTSSEKHTELANLNTKEEKKQETVKTENESSVKRSKFLSMWWLLVLLLPVGYFANKKFGWI